MPVAVSTLCSACLAALHLSVCRRKLHFLLLGECTLLISVYSGQHMFTILRKHLLINTCSLPIVPLSTQQSRN